MSAIEGIYRTGLLLFTTFTLFLIFHSTNIFGHEDETSNTIAIKGRVFQTIVSDEDLKTSSTSYDIVDENSGRSLHLHMKAQQKIDTHRPVLVRGKLLSDGQEMEVQTLEYTGPLTMAETLIDDYTRSAVVIVITNDTTCTASQAATVAEVEDLVFNRVNEFYQRATYGQVSFPRDTNGDGKPDIYYVTLVEGEQTTNSYLVKKLASQGVDVTMYQHKIRIDGCRTSGGGGGTLGCGDEDPYNKCWTSQGMNFRTLTHELGHNLGLHHASRDIHNVKNNSNYSASVFRWGIDAYGDDSDIMGGNVTGSYFNGAHVDHNGWFRAFPGASQEITSSGTYNIYPMSDDPATAPGPMVIKIPKANEGDSWYLSYRPAVGADEVLQGHKDGFAEGVNIHRYDGSLVGNMALQTDFITALKDGGRYEDWYNNISIEQVGRASSQSYVITRVNFNDPVLSLCQPAPPSYVVTTPQINIKSHDVQRIYVRITNNDGDGCPPTEFNVAESSSYSIQTFFPEGEKILLAAGETRDMPVDIWAINDLIESPVKFSFADLDLSGPTHAIQPDALMSLTATLTTSSCKPHPTKVYPASIYTSSTEVGLRYTKTIKVTNSDPENCPPTVYAFKMEGDSGLDFIVSPATYTLAPMEEVLVQVSIGSSKAGDFDFRFVIHDTDGTEPQHIAKSSTGEINFWSDSSQPDNEPPTVTITQPTEGQSASGLVTVDMSASDNVGLSRVALFVDGKSVGSDLAAPYSVSLDTTTLMDGSHQLIARAFDTSGLWADSAPVNITVSNSQPPPNGDSEAPVVQFLNPQDGQIVLRRSEQIIEVQATDNTSVTRVELRVDGALVCSLSNSPYQCNWSIGGKPGVSYVIEALAKDPSGNIGRAVIQVMSDGSGDSNDGSSPGKGNGKGKK